MKWRYKKDKFIDNSILLAAGSLMLFLFLVMKELV